MRWGYLRRAGARDALGVSDREFTKLCDAGVVTPVYLRASGRAYYSLAELRALTKREKFSVFSVQFSGQSPQAAEGRAAQPEASPCLPARERRAEN